MSSVADASKDVMWEMVNGSSLEQKPVYTNSLTLSPIQTLSDACAADDLKTLWLMILHECAFDQCDNEVAPFLVSGED